MMLGLVTHPSYDIPLKDGHKFPATKFSRLMAILARDGVLEGFVVVQGEDAKVDVVRIERFGEPARLREIVRDACRLGQLRAAKRPRTGRSLLARWWLCSALWWAGLGLGGGGGCLRGGAKRKHPSIIFYE